MQTLWQDLRFGLRMLRKSPGFTAVIVLTLGIGANSMVFSWINSILLNPIPGVEHTAEYAAVSLGHGFEDDGISYPDYCDLRDHNNSLSNLVAYTLSSMYLTGNEKPEKIWGHYVTTNYFDDADLPLFNLMPLDACIAFQSDNSRIGDIFVGAFGVLALIIAAVGVFGVTAYTTSQRTQEFGIRIALGAEPRAGLRLVVRQGAILAFLGTAIGLGVSFMLTRGLSSVLFGVSAADPVTFAACAVLLIGVTLTACYIPARRAMRVDPIVALRNE